MDSLALKAVVAELAAVHGHRVERVAASTPWDLELQLERNTTLTVCVHPAHDALYLTPGWNETPVSPPSPFLRGAEACLGRSRLARVVQRGLDRVVALVFQRRDRLGDPKTHCLVAELTGPGANLWLTDGEDPWGGRIRERLRGDRATGGRRLPAGRTYAPPPVSGPDAGGEDPAPLLEALRSGLETDGPGAAALVRAWGGVSPAAAREIWSRAGHLSPEEMVRAWLEFREEATAGRASFRPWVHRSPHGWEALPWSPGPGTPAEAPESSSPARTMSEAVAEAHRLQIRTGEGGAPSGPLARAVTRAIARVERALATVDSEAEADPAELRATAEALLATAHRIPAGRTEADIPDPHGGPLRRVRLNPKLGAAANAELYFKRAKKAERRKGRSGTRRNELRTRLRALRDLETRLSEGGDAAADEAWLREARDQGVQLPSPPLTEAARASGGELPASIRPRRYDLGEGWTALVGRSSRGNEVLTHEIARPDETWMHADQAAGSHLVLRHPERGRKPPESVVLAAAAIAAWFSKSRHSKKVPVLVTEKRHVRRARRAPTGTVLVGTHRTLMVAPRNPAGEES